MGAGLFGSAHFMNNGYNRSIIQASPFQSMSNQTTSLYNVTNNLRSFLSPMASGNPVHPLSSDFGLLSSAVSPAANDAAAMAMQAAAAQAATYQNSLKSATHLLNEMRNTNFERTNVNKTSPIILASLSHHYGNSDGHSLVPRLSATTTSSNVTTVKLKDTTT